MDRVLKEGVQKYLLNVVDTIDYPDDYTVVFHLNTAYATFDHNMANHFMEIVPCEGINGEFDMNTTAIGTGPFMLQSWTRDVEKVYVRHPEYYETGKPYLDGVKIVVMQDLQAQIAALRSGQLDSVSSGSADKRQIEQLAKEFEGSAVLMEYSISFQQLYMNLTRAPFDNPKVREAVSLAIDRENMLKAMRPDGSLSGPLPWLLDGAMTPEQAEKYYSFDPEKAKELLKEAGYPDGFEATMVLSMGYGAVVLQEAQWLQEDLAKVGIKVTLDVQEYTPYVTDTWPNKKYDMGFGPQMVMLSADEFLSAVYASDGSRNWYGFDDPKLDAMIKEQRTILDADERKDKLLEIQEYILEEYHNPSIIYSAANQTLYKPRIKNLWAIPHYGRRYWKDIWVTDGK